MAAIDQTKIPCETKPAVPPKGRTCPNTDFRRLLYYLLSLGLLASLPLRADVWQGNFTLIPVSQLQSFLKTTDVAAAQGRRATLGNLSAEPNQTWNITQENDGSYKVSPTIGSRKLALAAASLKTDSQLGTNLSGIDLEVAKGKPWQLWSIRENPNGSCSFISSQTPQKGLGILTDATNGTSLTLLDYNPEDERVQWALKPLAGTKLPAGYLGYPDIPKGVITNFVYWDKKFFPGTRRNVSVFIPAQYDGSKPACVLVQQDGYWPAEKGVLEKLIATGDMPVTIGIFVWPGDVPAAMGGTTGRRNRSFEYDSLGDRYACFLTGELLPYVAATFGLKLSDLGNDRCIAGGSSGGIAAFNAAWERPESFSRVYAVSGSFAAFRGGNEFPTLVRKFEPKPIRIYLTAGTNDIKIGAGDWYLLDEEMDKALTFSGYEHVFRAVDGPHCAGWHECFPDAMRYLWKNWPNPVQASPVAPRLRDIIDENQPWELLGDGYPAASSPVCNSTGEVFFSNPSAGSICRIGLNGKTTVFVAKAGDISGLSIGPKNELYTVSSQSGLIMCYDATGQGHKLAEGIRGNHVLARPDGSLYVTDSGGGGETGTVWLIKNGQTVPVDTGLPTPTGLACRPDQWLLSVAASHSKWVYSYQIEPDGKLVNKERYFWLLVADQDDDTGAESLFYAKEGQLFAATRLGIQVCADDGPTQVVLPLPDHSRVIGACLGGPGLNTLFAFGNGKIWKRKVTAHAIGAFSPWNGVSPSRL